NGTLRVDGDTWLAARCGSDLRHNDFYARPIRAHTSPIYVSSGETWNYVDRSELEYLLTLVDGGLSFVRQTALHHPHGTVTHHHGEADHLAYLEGPFHEARDAIHRRLHALNIPH